jgi:hypothetical protein
VEVQTAEHDADVRVQQAAIRNGGEVARLVEVATQRGVGAADVGDAFGGEFLLYAAFAENEDFVLGAGEFEDARDVDGGAVGGAEDFVL